MNDFLSRLPHKPGDMIGGKYRIGGILRTDSYFVTYRAFSEEFCVPVVLKTLVNDHRDNHAANSQLQNQAYLLAEIGRYPSVQWMYFTERIDGSFYLALEYLPRSRGRLATLEEYLVYRPPDLAQTLRWGIQICVGMSHAYEKGMRCHRNLAPLNIMIASDKSAKVSGFDYVLLENHMDVKVPESSKPSEGVAFCNPLYMAPEQFEPSSWLDFQTDLYSFGIILYQMINAGNMPFVGGLPKNENDMKALRVLRRSKCLPWIDSPLASIIYECLEDDKHIRPLGFCDVRIQLARLLEHLTGEIVKGPEF